jgi:DnaJ domain
VRRRPTFDELLNAALAADSSSIGGRMAAPSVTPFWFVTPHDLPPASRAKTAAARPPRPARQLTPSERRALTAMVSLGARLDENFTTAELRSAYRALARKYHPDRHPHSDRAEEAEWAQTFALVRDSYECLRRVADATR